VLASLARLTNVPREFGGWGSILTGSLATRRSPVWLSPPTIPLATDKTSPDLIAHLFLSKSSVVVEMKGPLEHRPRMRSDSRLQVVQLSLLLRGRSRYSDARAAACQQSAYLRMISDGLRRFCTRVGNAADSETCPRSHGGSRRERGRQRKKAERERPRVGGEKRQGR